MLQDEGHAYVPSASTITEILRRHDKLEEDECRKHKPCQRFEYENPNDLWQMDFKGDLRMANGVCYPFTVTDDHSRFNICLRACPDYTWLTVQSALTDCFRKYGIPIILLSDNGSPWGNTITGNLTRLTVWIIRVGIHVAHGRKYHPQTQGKEERFHRTLNEELLAKRSFTDIDDAQRAFDPWRERYNNVRPHDALGMCTPASRYKPSVRAFPETLPPVIYDEGLPVRKVQNRGFVSFEGREFRVGKALVGEYIAMQSTFDDGIYNVLFCDQKVRSINLSQCRKS